MMADECHICGDYAGSVDFCADGLELAKEIGDVSTAANLHVTWGLNLLEMEQYDDAFRHIDFAVDILSGEAHKNPCYEAWDDLFYALGMKLNLLYEKGCYDEAVGMRRLMEEAIRGMESSKDTPDGIVDMRRAEMDACYCLYYRQKRGRRQLVPCG